MQKDLVADEVEEEAQAARSRLAKSDLDIGNRVLILRAARMYFSGGAPRLLPFYEKIVAATVHLSTTLQYAKSR